MPIVLHHRVMHFFSTERGGGAAEGRRSATERREGHLWSETRGKKKTSVLIDQSPKEIFRYIPLDKQHNTIFDTEKVHSHIHERSIIPQSDREMIHPQLTGAKFIYTKSF